MPWINRPRRLKPNRRGLEVREPTRLFNLKNKVRGAKFVVVTLPVKHDFHKPDRLPGPAPLARTRQPARKSLFSTCDGHWSAAGHALAADCPRTGAAVGSALFSEQ